MRRQGWMLTLAAAGLALAGTARAQVGASVGLQSDYVYRGRSLTDGRPALTLSAAFDHPTGLYAGVGVTARDTPRNGVDLADAVLYAGYAQTLGAGAALDLGISQTRTVSYRPARRTFDFRELYAGVATEHASLRVHYAPDYYDSGVATLYVDAGAAIRPSETLRLFAHAGALTPIGGRRGPFLRRTRYDLSVGIARRLGDAELSLTWTRLAPAQRIGGRRERDAIVVGAAYFF